METSSDLRRRIFATKTGDDEASKRIRVYASLANDQEWFIFLLGLADGRTPSEAPIAESPLSDDQLAQLLSTPQVDAEQVRNQLWTEFTMPGTAAGQPLTEEELTVIAAEFGRCVGPTTIRKHAHGGDTK